MRSTAARVVLFILLLAGVSAAAWQYYLTEIDRTESLRETDQLAAFQDAVHRSIARARTAQQAYLAPGQGVSFWRTEFAEALADITVALENLRVTAEDLTEPMGALDSADRALRVYEGLDRKIRGFVDAGNTLMAADAVYEDGIKTSGVIIASVDQAHEALARPHRDAAEAGRRLQQMLAAGAVLGGVLVALLLTARGRDRRSVVAAPAVATAAEDHDLPLAGAARDDLRSSTFRAAPPPAPVAPVPHSPARPSLVEGMDDEAALDAAARVCTDLSRVKDGDQLRDALGRAARVLDASGAIVWIADASGRSLKPLLTYGYPEEALRRIPSLPRDADNATAAAWRHAAVQVVDATESAPGAIAVPMLVPHGCTGVLAAEIGHGREASAYTRAVAQIIAAQLAVLIPSEAPPDTPQDAPEPTASEPLA